MKEALFFVLTALGGYLLGSIDTGIIVSRMLMRDDVRNHGSGGAGMTNMLRTFGKKAAALTALGDVCKGFVAVLLGGWLFSQFTTMPMDWGKYLAFVGAVIGHWKPIFFGFKGGKGVLVSAGGLLALHAGLVPLLAAVFLTFFLTTRMVSAGSIAMGLAFPVVSGLYGHFALHMESQELWLLVAVTALIGGIVLFLHRANIRRILNGTEYRFTKKEPKNNGEKQENP